MEYGTLIFMLGFITPNFQDGVTAPTALTNTPAINMMCHSEAYARAKASEERGMREFRKPNVLTIQSTNGLKL